MKARFSLFGAASLVALLAVVGCKESPAPRPAARPPAARPPTRPNPFTAISRGDADTLRAALLEDTSLVRTQMPGGVTLLHYACSFPDLNIVEMLIVAGCDLNARNERGNTPLQTALINKQGAAAQALIKRDADVGIPNPNTGRTPLHSAVLSGIGIETVTAILSRRADVNAKDDAGLTPLHIAAQTDQRDIAALLVEKGADIEAKTRDGKTALDLARDNASGEILNLLNAKLREINPVKPPPVETTPPVASVSVQPTKATIAKGQVMLVIMSLGGNQKPGQRTTLVKNTGATPVKGELVWKTIDSNDNILTGSLNLSLDAGGQQDVRIGKPILPVTNAVPSTATSGYNPYYRPPRVSAPQETKFGFLVEFFIDGQLNNSQSQPPDAKNRIKGIEGN